MKVINNALQKEDFIKIKDTLGGEAFNWYFSKGVNYKDDDNCQFTHVFYDLSSVRSSFYNLLLPIIKILKPLAIVRIKANLLPREKTIVEHGMHTDFNYRDCKTAIYYVNTNNGYTKFLNGKKIFSEENKLIMFNSLEKHSGTTCTDSLTRIVINFNYFEI